MTDALNKLKTRARQLAEKLDATTPPTGSIEPWIDLIELAMRDACEIGLDESQRFCDGAQEHFGEIGKGALEWVSEDIAGLKRHITRDERRDASPAEEVAIELYEIGDSLIRMAEGVMGGNDHWCEQADRFQALGYSFASRTPGTDKCPAP